MTRKSMNKWNVVTAAGLGSLLLAATSACGGSEAASSDEEVGRQGQLRRRRCDREDRRPPRSDLVPADIKEAGVITMAADLHYPPTSFLANDNKTPIGYNVDIATLLGKTLGLEVEVKNVTWDNVIPGIASGRYDFTATNMTPTPERLEVLDMVTYWAPGSSLIVQKGNPLDLSIADESICGKKIAVMTGSSQQQDYLPLISEDCEAAGQEPVEERRPGQRRGRADPAGLEADRRRLLRHLAAGLGGQAAAPVLRAARPAVREGGGRRHRGPRSPEGLAAHPGAARRDAVPDGLAGLPGDPGPVGTGCGCDRHVGSPEVTHDFHQRLGPHGP